MATNLIQSRIAEELAHFLPFSKMDKPSLTRLVAETVVKYCEDQEVIFQINDAPQNRCWFIRQGQVSLFKEQHNNAVLVDICEEGELFGLRSLITTEPYSLRAVVHKEALLYGIPVSRLTAVMENNASVALHFANVLASRTGVEPSAADQKLDFAGQHIVYESPHKPLICSSSTAIQEAAILMSSHKVSSIIVVDQHLFPIGIVTQADLSKKVATGIFSIHEAVSLIMSSPIICSKLPLSYDDASLILLQNRIKHLVLTEDGSQNSTIIGVLTPQDLQQFNQLSAPYLIKQITNCSELASLISLANQLPTLAAFQLKSAVPMRHLTAVIGTLNEALIKKAASLIWEKHPVLKDLSWCWVNMGSMARFEQLFPTDQDNALLYNLPIDGKDKRALAQTDYKKALLQFTTELKDLLVQFGFENCPANMMASNPECCLSLTEWKEKFSSWIRTPTPKNVMHSTIFFDMKAVLGDESLLHELQVHLKDELNKHPDFFTYLAADALKNPPPIGFFKQFVVEKDGAHKDQFDIKARALMPLVDIARLLSLSGGSINFISTHERFTACANKEDRLQKLYLSAIKAHQQLLNYRFKAYQKSENSGRFLSLNQLDTFDKQILKQCFKPIEALRQLIEVRFNTAMLRL